MKKIAHTTLFIFIIIASTGHAQLDRVFDYENQKKINFSDSNSYRSYLQNHPVDLRFSMRDEEEATGNYFEVDSNRLLIIDWDKDGDLDLFYTGQNGWNNKKGTKYFENVNDSLHLRKRMPGELVEINRKSKYIILFDFPCCDAYLSTIQYYGFENKEFSKGVPIYAIGLKRHPDYMQVMLKGLSLEKGTKFYALKADFRSLHPYFGQNNKQLQKQLKDSSFVQTLQLVETTQAVLLAKQTINNETWHLVQTAVISLPKSLYRKGKGHKAIIMGWVKST